MGRFFSVFLFLCLTSGVAFSAQWEDLSKGWRFTKGNPADAHAVAFDDAAWEKVNVPHDWAITGPFNVQEAGFTGKLPWRGEGWYRKSFDLKAADKGQTVYVKFDVVMSSPKIYVNGKLAGQWDYGYSTFYLDVTEFVNFGQSNTLAVYVDTRNHDSRWYPGAGIYRKVELMVSDRKSVV